MDPDVLDGPDPIPGEYDNLVGIVNQVTPPPRVGAVGADGALCAHGHEVHGLEIVEIVHKYLSGDVVEPITAPFDVVADDMERRVRVFVQDVVDGDGVVRRQIEKMNLVVDIVAATDVEEVGRARVFFSQRGHPRLIVQKKTPEFREMLLEMVLILEISLDKIITMSLGKHGIQVPDDETVLGRFAVLDDILQQEFVLAGGIEQRQHRRENIPDAEMRVLVFVLDVEQDQVALVLSGERVPRRDLEEHVAQSPVDLDIEGFHRATDILDIFPGRVVLGVDVRRVVAAGDAVLLEVHADHDILEIIVTNGTGHGDDGIATQVIERPAGVFAGGDVHEDVLGLGLFGERLPPFGGDAVFPEVIGVGGDDGIHHMLDARETRDDVVVALDDAGQIPIERKDVRDEILRLEGERMIVVVAAEDHDTIFFHDADRRVDVRVAVDNVDTGDLVGEEFPEEMRPRKILLVRVDEEIDAGLDVPDPESGAHSDIVFQSFGGEVLKIFLVETIDGLLERFGVEARGVGFFPEEEVDRHIVHRLILDGLDIRVRPFHVEHFFGDFFAELRLEAGVIDGVQIKDIEFGVTTDPIVPVFRQLRSEMMTDMIVLFESAVDQGIDKIVECEGGRLVIPFLVEIGAGPEFVEESGHDAFVRIPDNEDERVVRHEFGGQHSILQVMNLIGILNGSFGKKNKQILDVRAPAFGGPAKDRLGLGIH